jgi:hypothetical protein
MRLCGEWECLMAELPLANGLIIDTHSRQALPPKVTPEAVELHAKKKVKDRKETTTRGLDTNNQRIRTVIADLPADPQSLTTAGVVWLYFHLGLSDIDIATCTGLSITHVNLIKGMKLFDQLSNLITTNHAKLGTSDIESRIQQLADKSMTTVEDIIDSEDVDAAVKLRAAQDMLDRAGHSAKQVIERRSMLEGGLTIRIVSDSNVSPDIPPIEVRKTKVIDITPEN